LISGSNAFSAWTLIGVSVTASTDLPIFASEVVCQITTNGTSGSKFFRRGFVCNATLRTVSVYFRRGTNNSARLCFAGDNTNFANFNLLTGTIGSRSAAVKSTMIPWRDGWYRCTMTFTLSTAVELAICIVSSATSIRAEVNTLNTNIYVAGARIEDGSFPTSYISTTTAVVTRACNFASVTGDDFSSWYNSAEGTFGVEF
jgi:hypothetical protein